MKDMLACIFSFLQDCINNFLVNVNERHNAPLITHGDGNSSPTLALTTAFQKNWVLTHAYHFLPVGLYDQLLTRHCWHQEEKQTTESHDCLVTSFYWKLWSLLGTREKKRASRVLKLLNTPTSYHLNWPHWYIVWGEVQLYRVPPTPWSGDICRVLTSPILHCLIRSHSCQTDGNSATFCPLLTMGFGEISMSTSLKLPVYLIVAR